ncbi:energy transducer TonB [Massilia antarctica]|uniref:energy transducer TonB n=1 Tax=Massilia antarctica TaxID=2765360 RepID=UPI0006BB7034|nr:energy transducer TonB [Massilia sp. H27-R4]MCY0911821.1 energy transducer TonB [Massilia sp. H27-R4]CUI06723.1 Ferric siderophore transport system, periplasmic binding protein TonB [Janthinobacterium sp. CG23_2]CUU30509.1 Ferric siderophore transport system, periplasmic binding protein TonB [Janthinobacterium sp. CG23_2]
MHFSQQHIGSGNKFTKMAIVTALHIAVGVALIHNMNRVAPVTVPEAAPIEVTPVREKPLEPPPEPEQFKTDPVVPPLLIPKPVIDILPPPPEVALTGTVIDKVVPPPAVIDTGRKVEQVIQPAVVQPAKQTRTAVLADASACVKPEYPARAARNGDTGTVNLALLVGVDGKVSDARVDKSSGSSDLDKAAVAALSMCKFKPATTNGVAEPGWARIAYVWTLD